MSLLVCRPAEVSRSCTSDGVCLWVRRLSFPALLYILFFRHGCLPRSQYHPLQLLYQPFCTALHAVALLKMYTASFIASLLAVNALSLPYAWRAYQNGENLLVTSDTSTTETIITHGTPCVSEASHTLVPPKTRSSPPSNDIVLFGPPTSGGVSIIDTINKWRSLYNVNSLSWSDQLAANAQKTGDDNHGETENHELNPGSFAQVITPGAQSFNNDLRGDTPFELCFVGWLCEVPSDSQLQSGTDQCALVKEVLNLVFSGTGHHDILTSSNYKSVGCAFTQNPNAQPGSPYQGLWVCDLGF